jgi:hypothetical protein
LPGNLDDPERTLWYSYEKSGRAVKITIESGKCLLGAFAALVNYFGSFVVLTIGWAFLGIAVFYATQIALLSAINAWPEFRNTLATWDERMIGLLLAGPLALVSIPGTVSIVVGWHRRIIQGLIPTGPFPVSGRAILAYLGRGALAFGIPIIPYVLSLAALRTAFPGATQEGGVASVLVYGWIFVGLVAASLVAMRLSVMLPAIAVGDRSITLRRAWSITKGNTWRLFLGAFVAALPFSAAGKICEKIADSPALADSAWVALPMAVGILVEMMSYAAVAGFFSLVYVQLRQALDDAPPADPLHTGS